MYLYIITYMCHTHMPSTYVSTTVHVCIFKYLQREIITHMYVIVDILWMCICIHVCVGVSVWVHILAYTHVHMFTYVFRWIFIYVNIYIYIYIYIFVCCMFICMCTYIHVCIYIYLFIHTYITRRVRWRFGTRLKMGVSLYSKEPNFECSIDWSGETSPDQILTIMYLCTYFCSQHNNQMHIYRGARQAEGL